MRHSTVVLSFLSAVALAQDTTPTIKWFFPSGYDGYDPVASIVKVEGPTTVAQLTCPTDLPDFDDTECGFAYGIEVAVISTTIYKGTMSGPGFTMTYSCDENTSATEMTCQAGIGGTRANSPGTDVGVLSGSEALPYTASVVAGASLLSAATGSPKSTGSGPAAGSQAQATGASATTSESPEETGAAFKYGIEGSALIALAGAAVLNAL